MLVAHIWQPVGAVVIAPVARVNNCIINWLNWRMNGVTHGPSPTASAPHKNLTHSTPFKTYAVQAARERACSSIPVSAQAPAGTASLATAPTRPPLTAPTLTLVAAAAAAAPPALAAWQAAPAVLVVTLLHLCHTSALVRLRLQQQRPSTAALAPLPPHCLSSPGTCSTPLAPTYP